MTTTEENIKTTGVDPTIAPGLVVYTIDNKRLGRVKETTETHLKVDARFRRDYWLARTRVVYVDERCVGMHFRKDELDLYRMSDPHGQEFAARSFETRNSPREGLTDRDVRGGFPL